MIDIQNGGLKLCKNPKHLGAKNFFFLSSVTSKGFHDGKSQKRELIPKPSLEVSLSTIEREKGREIKTYRC